SVRRSDYRRREKHAMRLIQVNFSKAQLDKLPKDDRIFFVQLAHFLDEIAILNKCLMFSGQTEAETEAQRSATAIQNLFFIRMLAGKVNEGWEMLEKSYFATKLSQKYYKCLPNEARESIDKLGRYFGRSNLIHRLRNEYAFHYKRENIDSEIEAFKRDVILTMFLTEHRGNDLFVFSDTIINYSILRSIDKDDIQKAMDRLYEELILTAELFLDFGHHVISVIAESLDSTGAEVDLHGVTIMEDVRLPCFIERRDQPSSQ